MPIRTLVLTTLVVSGLATAQPDGGPRRSTPDAGTRGTTVPDRPAPAPDATGLPAPRTQTSNPLGTGSETPAPTQPAPPVTPMPVPDVPPATQPPRATPH
ncbi:MAG: hypothetical protein ACXWK4_11520 [Myxococcaceae bacterium]